jgi:[protein-PII] uridylyltransferase
MTPVESIASERNQIISAISPDFAGRAVCASLTALADRLVLEAWRQVTSEGLEASHIVVVATGGYGRAELAPGSDVDITFVAEDEQEVASEPFVRALFKVLTGAFEGLHWQVGYAFRLFSDLPALDPATRTGLVDARFLAGSEEVFARFVSEFRSSLPVADFLVHRFEERESHRSRWGGTALLSEPNLRDGVGGLRDLQTARWVRWALEADPPTGASDAEEMLLAARNALHACAEKKLDVLVRSKHRAVAERIGLHPAVLVERVLSASEVLNAIWLDTIRVARRASYPLGGGRAENGHVVWQTSPQLEDAAFAAARAGRLGVAISPIERVSDPVDLPRVLPLLTSGVGPLRALGEAGLLEKLIPAIKPTRYLLSADSVHRYTVFEHTLKVIESLETLSDDDAFIAAWGEVPNRRPLFLGALFHDLGKADTSASHSVTGERLAREACDLLGVRGDELDTVAFLVREHLALAEMARTHDILHPKTAASLAQRAERPDRLAMLYLLTVADASNVGPGIWTPQMAKACADLFERSLAALHAEAVPQTDAVYRSEAERRLKAAGAADSGVEDLLVTMPTHYLLATPASLLPLHADFVRRAALGETIVTFEHNQDAQTTDLTLATLDLPMPGLLARILAVIYAHDVSVHAARAASTIASHPVALDVLALSMRGAPLPPGVCRLLSADLAQSLKDGEAIEALLQKHGKDPARRQEVLTHKFLPGSPAVLEIQTAPGRGMPYRVAKMLANFGWNVQVARIGQWADRAQARFYVDGPDGAPLESADVEAKLTPQPEER